MHWRSISKGSLFFFGTLVFSCLQLEHWLFISNPNRCAPGCVHLNVLILPDWNWTISVCAPRPWWSRIMFSSLGRSKTKWLSTQSMTNLCMAEGWKSGCEKHSNFSKIPPGNKNYIFLSIWNRNIPVGNSFDRNPEIFMAWKCTTFKEVENIIPWSV